MNIVQFSVRFLFVLAIYFITIPLLSKAGFHFNDFYFRLFFIASIVLSTKYNPLSSLIMSVIFVLSQMEIVRRENYTDYSNDQKF